VPAIVGEQVRQSAEETTRMVPSRQTMPNTIRTNGPANERRGRSGGIGGMGGTGLNPEVGVGLDVPELDIVHLARRGWWLAESALVLEGGGALGGIFDVLFCVTFCVTPGYIPGGSGPKCPSADALLCISLTTPITSRMAGQVR